MSGIDFHFTTTAARIAYTFDLNDRGKTVYDAEDGRLYFVQASGAGHAKMASLNRGGGYDVLPISLYDFHEVSSGGDVGAISAIGGHLASDTTPILRADAAESVEINWASSNSDIIGVQLPLPADFDGRRDVSVEITGSSGTTNAFSFTVETSWDGGALVTDTATGEQSASNHTATATISAADIPDSAERLTMMLTPAAHTTNAFNLVDVRIIYAYR